MTKFFSLLSTIFFLVFLATSWAHAVEINQSSKVDSTTCIKNIKSGIDLQKVAMGKIPKKILQNSNIKKIGYTGACGGWNPDTRKNCHCTQRPVCNNGKCRCSKYDYKYCCSAQCRGRGCVNF